MLLVSNLCINLIMQYFFLVKYICQDELCCLCKINLILYRSVKFLAIERLLWIAESYILSVEEIHCVPRNILPHGASFHGYQLNLLVKCEALKVEFTLQVSTYKYISKFVIVQPSLKTLSWKVRYIMVWFYHVF